MSPARGGHHQKVVTCMSRQVRPNFKVHCLGSGHVLYNKCIHAQLQLFHSMDASERELQRVRDRELELKRITGEISCAECRRLKLKCDRKIPCSSCVRRGHRDICPTGTSIGPSRRRTVARSPDTDPDSSGCVDVSDKLVAMSERIRALEDALQIATSATHPLLSPEHVSIKRTSDVILHNDRDESNGIKKEDESVENAIGTLTIGEGKAMQFLGASAGEHLLVQDAFDNGSALSQPDFSGLPAELVQLGEMWPFTPAHLSSRSKLYQLGTFIPPLKRAQELVDAIFSRPVWVISQPQVDNELIPLFYPHGRPISPSLLKFEHLHDLALLFMILACGCMNEIVGSLLKPESERYNYLARTAFSMGTVEQGSLSGCQALVLLSTYEVLVGRKQSMESAWKLMSLSMIHAASIGLHRDPSHWNFDAATAERRREVFWELFVIDKWKSLGSGRPTHFPAQVVDCEFPHDEDMILEDGTKVENVRRWKNRFARDVLGRLAEQMSSARPRKYWEVTVLDRLVRDFDVHPMAARSLDPSFMVENLSQHPFFSVWWKERALLYVHRGYFARAILEHGDDPIHSPYAVSFLAALRSASTMLKTARLAFGYKGYKLKFLGQFWAMTLSAGVIIGSVAARASTSFAASAFEELVQAIRLFEQSDNPVGKHGLRLLSKLRDKAIAASSSPSSRSGSHDPLSASQSGSAAQSTALAPADDEDEELHAMRGTTRRIERPGTPRMNSPRSSSSGERVCRDSRTADVMVGSLSPTATREEFPQPMQSSPPSGTPEDTGAEFVEPGSPVNGHSRYEPVNLQPTTTGDERFSSLLSQLGLPQQELPVQPTPGIRLSQNQALTFSGSSTNLDGTSPLDRAFEDIFKSSYTGDAFDSLSLSSQPPTSNFTPYYHPPVSVNALDGYALQSISLPSRSSDQGTLSAEANGAASGDLWQSFMQEFRSMEGTDGSFQNWDAMELA